MGLPRGVAVSQQRGGPSGPQMERNQPMRAQTRREAMLKAFHREVGG